MEQMSRNIVGNIGLYFVCWELSRLGWNVIPTSRNARGVDVLIYSQDAAKKLALQVKALSKRNAVGVGKECFIGDFLIVVVGIQDPKVFILPVVKANKLISKKIKNGISSYWLESKDYEEAAGDWKLIGHGNLKSQPVPMLI